MTQINAKKQKISNKVIYSTIIKKDIHCPICKNDKTTLLYAVTANEAAQHFVLKEIDVKRNIKLADHINKLWKNETCEIIKCASCEFIFANPYIGGDATFYSLAYERSGYPKWKWEYQKTKEAITNIVTGSNSKYIKLIEIGAGDGAFVKKISPELISKQDILCLEFSDYGREQIENHGIKCLDIDIRALNSKDDSEKFDIICLFQVLEHMDRLEELFETFNSISNHNSHIFISVPNYDQITFNETQIGYLDMPPNHIGRWNLNCFEKTGSTFGWSISEHAIEPLNRKANFMQLIAYNYLLICQDHRTLANKIESIKMSKTKKILRIIFAGLYSIPKIHILIKAISNENLGGSQWIHFIKNPNN